MFFKSVRLFFEVLVLLLALYFVITRALVTWVQFAPHQVAEVTQAISGVEIDFDRLKLEQTWTGFKLQVHNLRIDQPSMQLRIQSLLVDYHLLAPIWPSLAYGERLDIQQGTIQLFATEKTPAGFELESWLYQASKFWQRANVTDVRIELATSTAIHINSWQVSRAERWNALADIDLILSGENEDYSAGFQIRARLTEDLFGLLSSGDISVRQTHGLSFVALAQVWPAFQSSIQRLPSGEFQFDMSAEVQRRQLKSVTLNINLDKLAWGQLDDDLPRSASAQLNWNQTDGPSDFMQATLSDLHLDQISVVDWSPVTLSKHDQLIRFNLTQVSLMPFKPVLHAIAGDYVDSLQAFELRDVDVRFDLHEARLDLLKAKVDLLSWQDLNLSLDVESLEVDYVQDQFRFQFAKPLALSTNHTEQQDYLLDLGPGLVVDYKANHQAWWLASHTMWLNEFPIQIEAHGDVEGFLDLHLKSAALSLAQVKSSLLPFGLMPPGLQDWLKAALISGDKVEAQVWLQGQIADFPFKSGVGHFKASAQVANAELVFNPDWPKLSNFDAQLEFTPFNLKISSPSASIHGALAENVSVNINNLDEPDIAVTLSGVVKAEAQNAVDFLLASPLADKLGMREFLKNQAKLDGQTLVKLDRIWIPVKGLEGQDLEFAGKVKFDDTRLVLFDRLEFDQISGQFHFDDAGLATQQAMQARGLGADDIRLVIQTEHEHKRVTLDIDGQSQLKDTFALEGSLPFEVQIYVPYKAGSPEPLSIEMKADPKAVISHWPSPFKSEQINREAWQAKLSVSEGLLNLDARLAGQLRILSDISLRTNDSTPLQSAMISLGEVASTGPAEKGIHLNAALEEIDLDAWLLMTPVLKALLQNHKQTDQSPSELVWGRSQIKTQRLRFLNQSYDALDLSWFSDVVTQQIKAEVQAAYLQARIDYLKPSGIDVLVERAQLKWPEGQNWAEKTSTKTCQAEVSSALWPDIRFYARQLELGTKLIDTLSFKLEDQSLRRSMSDIRFSFANQVGTGQASYDWYKELDKSELALTLQSNQVAALSEFIGFKKGFSGKEASFKTKLDWPQGLSCFNLNKVEGDFNLAFNNGVIEQIEPGLARLLGLLSVDSFIRRLKLDIKDVTNEGMEYDRIRANGTLAGGAVQLERLNVSSPGVQVAMNGQILLQDQLFNLDAQVTPAMGAALPTVATLLGLANPVTGILAYILAKNLSFVNEDIITYKYQITGPWKEPEIKSKGSSVLFK